MDIKPEELDQIKSALVRGFSDISQHVRLAEYNLTGMDHGKQYTPPNPPLLCTRHGINISKKVMERMREALLIINRIHKKYVSETQANSIHE